MVKDKKMKIPDCPYIFHEDFCGDLVYYCGAHNEGIMTCWTIINFELCPEGWR